MSRSEIVVGVGEVLIIEVVSRVETEAAVTVGGER
jgi:hypothetical protein